MGVISDVAAEGGGGAISSDATSPTSARADHRVASSDPFGNSFDVELTGDLDAVQTAVSLLAALKVLI